MVSAVHRRLGKHGLTAAFLVAILAVVWAVTGPVGAQEETTVPPKPTGLTIATEQGSLAVSVDWDDVDGATEYLVRWREAGPGNNLTDGVRPQSSKATITVADYGDWVIRLEACNDAGCGPHRAQRFSVEPAPEPTPTPGPTPEPAPEPAADLPLRPTGLRIAAAPGSLRVAASWNVAQGATSYQVRWRRVQQNFLPADSLTTADTAVGFTLSGHGDWVVRVEACNDAGCGPGARQVVSTRPLQPTNLSVSTPPGKLELTATWGAARGATSHVLKWRDPDGSFSADDQVTVTGTTTSFTVAEHGRWVVRVEGCNEAGCGRGIVREITTKPPPPPEKPPRPANLSVSFLPGNRDMTATWDAAPRADSYLLRWREHNESFQSDNQVTTTETTAAFTVPSQGDWVVRLEACNTSGCGPGAVRGVTTRPSRASNLSLSSSPERTLELTATWNAAAGATSYLLKWRRPGGSFASDQQATATGATATLTLSGRGVWVVRLEGCNDGGCGPGIAQAFTTRPGPPTNLSVSHEPGSLDMTANWDAAPGATSHRLQWRRPYRGFLAEDQVTTTGTAAFTVSGHGGWTVQVVGCNAAGCGPGAIAQVVVARPVCDRTPQVRDKLASLIGKACGSITAQDLAGLVNLELEMKGITSLKVGDFQGLSGLLRLYLNDNKLVALPADVFDGMPNLTRLALQDNQLTALPDGVFDHLSRLETLGLSGNSLAEVPEGVFDNLPKLRQLTISGNNLTELPDDMFDGRGKLEEIILSYNSLTVLPAETFDGSPNLNYVDMGHNGFTELPEDLFDTPSGLKTLYLNDNKLTELTADLFDGQEGLKHLYLSDNDLTELPEDLFDGLDALRWLDLQGNDLTELADGLFDGLDNLRMLFLQDNPGAPFTLDLPGVQIHQ